MVPGKKHPLEVFRSLGSSSTRSKDSWRRNSTKRTPARKKEKKRPLPTHSPAVRPPARVEAARGRMDHGQAEEMDGSPGDFRVTLTLNQVLVSLLVVAALIFSGYFFGFYKGGASSSPSDLSVNQPDPKLIEDRPGTVKTTPTPVRKERWGVMVATYDAGKDAIVNQTRKVLIERGFDKKVIFNVFYEANRKHAIIVGSFDRKDNPQLLQLVHKIRTINDFPGGDPAPFKSAWVVRHPAALREKYGD